MLHFSQNRQWKKCSSYRKTDVLGAIDALVSLHMNLASENTCKQLQRHAPRNTGVNIPIPDSGNAYIEIQYLIYKLIKFQFLIVTF